MPLLSFWDVNKTNLVSRFFNGMLSDIRNKKKKEETRFARRTDLPKDQTLDKTPWPDSETDFSSIESVLLEWHACKEHNFPVSK